MCLTSFSRNTCGREEQMKGAPAPVLHWPKLFEGQVGLKKNHWGDGPGGGDGNGTGCRDGWPNGLGDGYGYGDGWGSGYGSGWGTP